MSALLFFSTRLLFLALVLGAVVLILTAFLPQLPPDMVNAIATVIRGVNQLGMFLPLQTMSQMLALVPGFFICFFTWDAIDWFLRRTRQ